MKKLGVLLLAIGLLVSVSSSVSAFMGNFRADMNFDPYPMSSFEDNFLLGSTSMDTWYSIQPQAKNLKVSYVTISDFYDFRMKYEQNDQTFLRGEAVKFTGPSDDKLYMLSGSYLFNFGLYVGAWQLSDDEGSDITIFTPGYRFSFGDNSYIALQYNHCTDDGDNSSYVVSGRYFTDNIYLYVKYLKPNETGVDPWYNFGLNFKAADALVIGVKYLSASTEGYAYEAGMTWAGADDSPFTIDVKYGKDTLDAKYYGVSGMFRVGGGFSLGVQYDKLDFMDRDPQYAFKVKYIAGKNEFALKYIFENDDSDAMSYLVYQLKF